MSTEQGAVMTADALDRFAAALGTAIAVVMVAAAVWMVLNIVAYWRIFKKSGEPGWKSLIPIYSNYVLYKQVWSTVWFWVTTALNFVIFYTQPVPTGDAAMTVLQMAGAACMAASAVFYVLLNYKTAKAFGKGIGFTLGLIFLQPIFLMILGFGSARYQGPQ